MKAALIFILVLSVTTQALAALKTKRPLAAFAVAAASGVSLAAALNLAGVGELGGTELIFSSALGMPGALLVLLVKSMV